jgi:hypothetical protein
MKTEPINTKPPSLEECQALYRAVLMGALRDIGYGKQAEVEAVMEWVSSDSFEVCCDLANWESDWVKQIMVSSSLIGDSIRKQVVKECMDMLRVVIRVTKHDKPGYSTSTVGRSIGKTESIAYDESVAGSNYTISKLSRMSSEMHSRKKEDAVDDAG